MKTFLRALLVFHLAQFLLQYCANPMAPTGGPQDTIPPVLVTSNPVHKSVNFDGNEILLEFDEFVNSDKLQSNLLITPNYDNRYKATARKNFVTLEFDQDFQDSTTFTLNFFNGITDITERNPPTNLVLAFSTGPFIDSLQITGRVRDLYTQEPISKMSVALYPFSDTLDYQTQAPLYFTTTDEQGAFLLDNIKNDQYKLFAFLDENGNKLFDAATEFHAGYGDTIQLIRSLDSLQLKSTLINLASFRTISARPFGRNFEIRYTKPVISYEIKPLDPGIDSFTYYHQRIDDFSTIRIYNADSLLSPTDSLGIVITAQDTIQQELKDTVYMMFRESKRKPGPFTVSATYLLSDKLDDLLSATYTFSKPVRKVQWDKIRLHYDSSIYISFDSTFRYQFNHNNTRLSIQSAFDWDHYAQEISQQVYERAQATFPDSLIQFSEMTPASVSLLIDSGAFQSIEYETLNRSIHALTRLNLEDLGTISYAISTSYSSFTVQLITPSFDVIRTEENSFSGIFTKVSPGSYSIRVLIDADDDGRWDPGNPFIGKDPEPIYLYPSFTDIKSNWEIELDDIQF